MPGNLRAVLDTNVILAAHCTQQAASPNAEILSRWHRREFVFLYSADTLAEYAKKLLEHGIPAVPPTSTASGSSDWSRAAAESTSSHGGSESPGILPPKAESLGAFLRRVAVSKAAIRWIRASTAASRCAARRSSTQTRQPPRRMMSSTAARVNS